MSAENLGPDEAEYRLEEETVVQELDALLQRQQLLRELTQNGKERIDLRSDMDPVPKIVAKMTRQLVAGVDFSPRQRVTQEPFWPIRAGVRLETLAFSPWLANVPSIYRLPKSERAFVAHYEQWLGETRKYEDGTTLFEANFEFALEELYRKIDYLEPEREKPNSAYLMLMSGHFRSAAQMQPKLLLPSFGAASVVDAFMLLAELQRAANLGAEMERCSSLTNADIRKAIRSSDHDHILVEAKGCEHLRRIVDYAPFWRETVNLGCTVFEKQKKYIKVDGLALRRSYLDEAEQQKLLHSEQGDRPKTKPNRSNNNQTAVRASSIKPKYAFSYYSIDYKEILYTAIEHIAKYWNASQRAKGYLPKRTEKSGNQSDRARFALVMQKALDSHPAKTLESRSERHMEPNEIDFKSFSSSSEDAFRQRQRNAAAAGNLQLPPPGCSGGSVNFCHHYWWHRYADDALGIGVMKRNFDNVPLTDDEREDLTAAMTRIEGFVEGRSSAIKSEQILMVKVFLDYATCLGSIATDPSWSNRLVAMALDVPSKRGKNAKQKGKGTEDQKEKKSERKPYEKYDILSRNLDAHRAKRTGGMQQQGQWDRIRKKCPVFD